jgi:hypothetical protein
MGIVLIKASLNPNNVNLPLLSITTLFSSGDKEY